MKKNNLKDLIFSALLFLITTAIAMIAAFLCVSVSSCRHENVGLVLVECKCPLCGPIDCNTWYCKQQNCDCPCQNVVDY